MSETPTDQQLAEWEALEAAATPGRWEAITDDHGRDGLNFSVWAGDADGKYGKYITERVMTSAADAEFIAAARNAFPVLLRAFREARDKNRRVRLLHSAIRGGFEAKDDLIQYLEAERDRMRRAVLAEIDSWTHTIADDCWYTCPAATEERDGGECCADAAGTQCNCGTEWRRERIRAALSAPTGQEESRG